MSFCLDNALGSLQPLLKSHFFNVYLFLRQRESTNGGGAERKGDTESEAGSRLRAISPEPDAGLELRDREIVTWVEVGRLTDWAIQAPLKSHFLMGVTQTTLLDTTTYPRACFHLLDPFPLKPSLPSHIPYNLLIMFIADFCLSWLESKFREGRDPCPFPLPIYPKHLEQCLAHNRRPRKYLCPLMGPSR